MSLARGFVIEGNEYWTEVKTLEFLAQLSCDFPVTSGASVLLFVKWELAGVISHSVLEMYGGGESVRFRKTAGLGRLFKGLEHRLCM